MSRYKAKRARIRPEDSRKELLRPDDNFTLAAGNSARWAKEHRMWLYGGLMVTVLLGALGWWATDAMERVQLRASDAYAHAGKILAAQVDGDAKTAIADMAAWQATDRMAEDTDTSAWIFKDEALRFEAAVAPLIEAHEGDPKGVGIAAALRLAEAYVGLERSDDALKLLRKLDAQLTATHPLRFVQRERLAQLLEAEGQDGLAMQIYATDGKKPGFGRDTAQLAHARLAEKRGDLSAAIAALDGFEAAYPGSNLVSQVETRLRRLQATAAATGVTALDKKALDKKALDKKALDKKALNEQAAQ